MDWSAIWWIFVETYSSFFLFVFRILLERAYPRFAKRNPVFDGLQEDIYDLPFRFAVSPKRLLVSNGSKNRTTSNSFRSRSPVAKTAKKTRSVHCGSELAADGGPKDTRSLLEPPLIWIHRTRQRHGRRTGPHKNSSRLERFSNSSVLFSRYVVSLYLFFRYEGLIFESRNA